MLDNWIATHKSKIIQFILASIAIGILSANLGNELNRGYLDYQTTIPLEVSLFFAISWLFKVWFINKD